MSDERIAAEKEMRLASLRDKELQLIQAINESHDIETRLLLKGRVKEAKAQQAQTAALKQKEDGLRTEIHDLS